MVRGLSVKSRFLLGAGATVLLGALGGVPLPAKAADLGGDCCADLEERVAELEATTVRKGNKKVSVTALRPGQQGRAVLGRRRRAEHLRRRQQLQILALRHQGSAKITGDWSAGYRLEVESTTAASNAVNQYNRRRRSGLRRARAFVHSYMYLNNKSWGEVRWGLTSTPIYNITKDTNVTELEDTMHSDNRMNQGFLPASEGIRYREADLSNLRWSDISRCYDSSNAFVCSTRKNGVAYWSPKWEGFSASWGCSRTTCGVAPRYQKEWARHVRGRRRHRLRETPRRASAERRRWLERLQARHRRLGRFSIDQAQADRVCSSSALSASPTTTIPTRDHAGVFTGTSDPLMMRMGCSRSVSSARTVVRAG